MHSRFLQQRNWLAASFIFLLTLCATRAFSQAPNAWQINDNTGSSGVNQYILRLSPEQVGYAHVDGWSYDLVGRMVSGTTGAATHSMAFGDGTHRYYIYFDLDSAGRLTAQLLGDGTNYLYTLTSAAQGTNYHTHELTFDPAFGNVTYSFDGNTIATWYGNISTGQSNQVMWGANSSTGTGVMNYHHVEFSINGQGVIGSYDAGFAGNPATAPSPTTQGWDNSFSGTILPQGDVSPDSVSFPPLVVNLSTMDVTAGTATVQASINPFGLAATYYWEYGETTNYGNATLTNSLPAGLGATSVSAGVGGLSPGTTWHFRCVAANAEGITYGPDMLLTPLTVTTLADNGPGSLRQTIAETHSGGAIAIATNGVISLTGGELLITKDLSITGPGQTNLAIDAAFQSRVLEISNASVTLEGLTIRNGEVSMSDTNSFGGGILAESNSTLALVNSTVSNGWAYNGGSIANKGGVMAITNSTISSSIVTSSGGGVFSDGTMTLDNCTFYANSVSGSGSGWGAGIFSQGGLTINHCTFSYNSIVNFDPDSGGGGIFSEGTLTIGDSTISDNQSRYGEGGGIQSGTNGAVTVTDSTFFDNSAYRGGAIALEGGVAAINNATFATNFATANGAGILNHGALTLDNSALNGNSAQAGAPPDGGGGVFNDGTLAVNNSTFSGNIARNSSSGGGIYNDSVGAITITNSILSDNDAGGYGGGVFNNAGGRVDISDSTISGNLAYTGGGISNEGTNTLNRSTLADNTANGVYAGGIYNLGDLSVASSTFTGNVGLDYGGGICNFGALNAANSTFSGNLAQAQSTVGYGGGIYNTGTNRLNNCTLSGNTAGYGGGIENSGGLLRLTNTICAGNLANTPPDISGAFSGAKNLTNGTPLLAPLGNYGGPTQTMPPLAGSPAIDAGKDSVTSFLAADERGYARKSGAHVDIGAVELQGVVASNPPLLMTPAALANGSFTFGFTNVADAEFAALASTNLSLPLSQWSSLGLATQGAPGQYQFTDPDATNYPQRFYRVVSP